MNHRRSLDESRTSSKCPSGGRGRTAPPTGTVSGGSSSPRSDPSADRQDPGSSAEAPLSPLRLQRTLALPIPAPFRLRSLSLSAILLFFVHKKGTCGVGILLSRFRCDTQMMAFYSVPLGDLT